MLKALTRPFWGLFKGEAQGKTLPWVEFQLLENQAAQTTPHNFHALTQEGYGRNVYVYRAINLVAQGGAAVPPLLYQRGRDGDEEIHDHPLLDLLRRPNPAQGGRRFVEALIAMQKVAGNAYLIRAGPQRGLPQELHILRPDKIRVIQGDGEGEVAGYLRTVDNQIYGPDMILHLSNVRLLDPLYGISDVQAAGLSVDQSNVSARHNLALLQNSGKRSAVLMTKGSLDESQKEMLKTFKNDSLGGPLNAGKIAVIEGTEGAWQEVGMTAQEMDWLAGRRMTGGEIAIALGVAPELVGIPDAKQYASFREAKKGLYTETIIPILEYVYDELNNWLVPQFGTDLYLRPHYDQIDVLQADRTEEYTRINEAYRAGWLTLGEARQETEYDIDERYGERYQWEIEYMMRWGVWPPNPTSKAKRENKAFNLVTEEQKALYWKQIDDRRAAWTRQVAKRVEARFEDERQTMTRAIRAERNRENLEAAAAQAIDEDAWEQMIASTYLAIMEDFGEETIEQLKRQGLAIERKQDIFGIAVPVVMDWIARHAGLFVQQVSQATRLKVSRHILAGIEEGESIFKIAKRIDTLYLEQIIPHRSQVIGRTESMRAASAGSQMAAQGTGIELKKVWISTRDGRTREAPDSEFDHATADGQIVPLNDPFIVSGEQLMYPGDYTMGASKGNHINCRCTHSFLDPELEPEVRQDFE